MSTDLSLDIANTKPFPRFPGNFVSSKQGRDYGHKLSTRPSSVACKSSVVHSG